MISVQASEIQGSCIGPDDSRKRGDFLLYLLVNTIYSKFTPIEFVFVVSVCIRIGLNDTFQVSVVVR